MYCKYCGKKLDDGVSFCTGCGKPVQKQIIKSELESRNKKTKKTTMLLLILLLISIGGNVFCAFRIAQLSEMYEESRKNAKAYYNSYLNQKFENDEIKNNGSYYNENAVIVDIDSWTYHRSNCPKTGCRIMDQGNAFALGFSPCDTCFNPNW